MGKWKHVNIFVDSDKAREKLAQQANCKGYPVGEYKELVVFIKSIVDSFGCRVRRYFFMFEPYPDCFLALEFIDDESVAIMVDVPNFIKKVELINSEGDEGNGEVALDMFHAATKFAFFRCSEKYRPVYSYMDEHKLIHCFCNTNLVSWGNESKFYFKGLLQRGIKWHEVFLFMFKAGYYQWRRWIKNRRLK